MTLHIFNPEHDLALASGIENFTAPHAGRQLRHDLGWLPALWANEDDCIVVDDVEHARRKLALRRKLVKRDKECIVGWGNMLATRTLSHISPWGWDAALKARLMRTGIDDRLLPTDVTLERIRQLSHRRTSAQLLEALLRQIGTETLTGEACECTSEAEVAERMGQWQHIAVKAPWSSSGRGVRFVNNSLTASVEGWVRNVLLRQGSVMVEPLYNKVKDFGMEFISDGQGTISYEGLSLFHTVNGAYTGNLLATEARKRSILETYVPGSVLDEVRQAVCQELAATIGQQYTGPFGIDMMIVGGSSPCLMHPCVEINLRRTMGHVALALTRLVNPSDDDEVMRVMRIVYEEHQYKLRIERL